MPRQSGHAALPSADTSHDITRLLIAWRSGDRDALDRLFPIVYEELRRIAHRRLTSEPSDHTLSTTALVNEAYLKLVDQTRAKFVDRAHFFALAARVMRRVLVDYARRHEATKRGAGAEHLTLEDEAVEDAAVVAGERAGKLIALDEALTRLAEIDNRLCQVVECRFFGGLTEEETAQVLDVTARTVRRDWVKAKGWLYDVLRD